MYHTACVVKVRLPGTECAEGTCCGILLDSTKGLVLAHGSCLGPFVENGVFDLTDALAQLGEGQRFQCEVLLQESGKGGELAESQSEGRLSQVRVSTHAGQADWIPQGAFHHEEGFNTKFLKNSTGFYSYSKFCAQLIDLFQCHDLTEALATVMPESSWELVDRKDGKPERDDNNKASHKEDKSGKVAQQLLSSFVVLKLDNWTEYESQLYIRPATECRLGDRVEVCSTPFGGLKPDAFINTRSRGIVSNLAGRGNCLLLSDARCILGGEGAPLYTFAPGAGSERCLTGVIIASLCWKNEEWVGFCLACDISALLRSLPAHHLSHPGSHHPPIISSPAKPASALHLGVLMPEVVLVKVGQTWGSGVVISPDQGVILTCSHVIKDSHLYTVQVQGQGQHTLDEVRVVFRQQPLRHQFDLGVLRLTSSRHHTRRPSTIAANTAVPVEGEEVFVVGHALFGAQLHLQPSVTSGIISKVININKVPVMIQTTCAVHAGASGGALVDTRGRLLGIVVCNARDNTTGASFPHVNMSIPVYTVWPLLTRYLHSKDVGCLEKLNVRSSILDSIWSLGAVQDTGVSLASKL